MFFYNYDKLIQVCQNSPIDFKRGIMIPNTVWYNVESAATRYLRPKSPYVHFNHDIYYMK